MKEENELSFAMRCFYYGYKAYEKNYVDELN